MTDPTEDPLCRRGRWMLLDDATDYLGSSPKQMRVFKNQACPPHLHFEHGAKVHAPAPFDRFQFVFISPPDTVCQGEEQWSLTLAQWSVMCHHLGNLDLDMDEQSFMSSCAKKDSAMFEEYTGHPATPSNIKRALEEKLMKSSKHLESSPTKRVGRPKKNGNNNQAAATTKTTTTTSTRKSIMPSEKAINKDVIKRLGEIKPVNVASDLALAELAGMMRLKKMDTVCFVGDNNRNMAFALWPSLLQIKQIRSTV